MEVPPNLCPDYSGKANRAELAAVCQRTADYAFGPAGSRDLVRNKWYREMWRKVERGEERRLEATGIM